MSLCSIPDDKTPLTPPLPFSADSGWRSDDVPDDGAIVAVYASDMRGFYRVPFAVQFKDDEWWNAKTGERLECFVEGWREWR